ncbi:MAG: hypothetical protein WA957_12705 [Alteraurantiacibacter sp.]
MATSPQHIDFEMQAPASRTGKPPIIQNPAFAWIMALWFAALLGIGSLILPVALLENASSASGLATVLPMAAPPLGSSAQLLVALATTILGGLMGLACARRIAKPRHRQIDPVSDLARKSFDPEAGDDNFDIDSHDDFPPPSGRRRSLAIEADNPEDYLDIVPLPGAFTEKFHAEDKEPEPEIALVEEFESEEHPHTSRTDAPAEAPLQEEAAEKGQPLYLDRADELVEEDTSTQPSLDTSFTEEFAPDSQPAEPLIDIACSEAVDEHDGTAIGIVNDPASTMKVDKEENLMSDMQMYEIPNAPQPVSETLSRHVSPHEDGSHDDGPLDDGPLDDGLVQLVQRLALTLDRHREWSAEQAERKARNAADEEGAQALVPKRFDPAVADEAAQATAAYFGSQPRPQPEPLAQVTQSAEGVSRERAEPTALFPDQSSASAEPRAEPPKPSNDDNERALREALMNLQRMAK